MIFGFILVLVGAIFLAATLEVIEGVTASDLWPVLLIGLGLASISGSLQVRSWRRSWRRSDGGRRSRRRSPFWDD